ncbi:MAG: hypothetical protein ACLFPV_10765 [Spirochaetaceae bacterium]
MIDIKNTPSLQDVAKRTTGVFETAAKSTRLLRKSWDPAKGTPVFTVEGRYTSRGWTEWTQGFQFGNALYLYDATEDSDLLEWGRGRTLSLMAPHLSHTGVHDHGFNNVSTYGNLLRLAGEGRIDVSEGEQELYRTALKVSGAVQAARWTDAADGLGFVPSFNGRHSLFADTIRSMRALALAHQLGHMLMSEQDERISLLKRLLLHAETTARYNVYFGTGRDSYDIRGRVAHESIFNTANGVYRCPNTQQGYCPYTTWTRGLSWILLGYAELLEWLETRDPAEFEGLGVPGMETKDAALGRCLETARAVSDFFIDQTPTDGVCYWDTGAPGLVHLGDYLSRPADPYNDFEPVDSSAAAICAQGLLRLGRYLGSRAPEAGAAAGDRYTAAGLRVCDTLFGEPYLATTPNHEGILLHVIYHRPNGWDYVPPGSKVPNGESALWGDYHLLELAVYVKRLAESKPYLSFFAGL